jgi:signal transduction histidine kinase
LILKPHLRAALMPFFPLPVNEDDRLAALYSYSILDTAEERDFDELTTLASAICQTPIALISLVDDKRQWFKAHRGIEAKETPREYSFCAHTIVADQDIMVVDDATTDERFANNPLVTGDTNMVFYAGVPLINEDGLTLGTLCVIDHNKRELSEEQASSLKIIAKQVVDKLEMKRKNLALAKLNQELLDSNVFIQKFASMAAHDIKNPLTSILLASQALKIQLQKAGDERSIKLADINIASTQNLMHLVDDMLAYSRNPALLLANKENVYLPEMLKKVIALVSVPAHFDIILSVQNATIQVSVVALEQIFINLLTNAIRYNDKKEGKVHIRFTEDESHYHFEIEDNGIGIAKEYHDKIFQNSFTLKIADRYNQKGTGIGLSTVTDLVAAMKGTIRLESEIGQGSTFFVRIPR